ncbi:MAG: hypothetical protein K1X92_11750 [Bacteroidia bacterium]|nr:hypothetical protein [Bacteroidia bacterium]
MIYEGVWRASGNNLILNYRGNRGVLSEFFTEESYMVEEISGKEVRLNSGNGALFIADKAD